MEGFTYWKKWIRETSENHSKSKSRIWETKNANEIQTPFWEHQNTVTYGCHNWVQTSITMKKTENYFGLGKAEDGWRRTNRKISEI